MRYALLADVHGNETALEAVLQDSGRRGVDAYILLGDLFTFGPRPREVAERLTALPVVASIIGNHDLYLRDRVFERPNARMLGMSVTEPSLRELVNCEKWCLSEMGEAGRRILDTMVVEKYLDVAKSVMLCTHAVPWDVESDFGLNNLKPLDRLTTEFKFDYYWSAHTHVPHLFRSCCRSFINPGSVGMPWDGDSRASYCLISCEVSVEVTFVRVEYEVSRVVSDVMSRAIPGVNKTVARLIGASK